MKRGCNLLIQSSSRRGGDERMKWNELRMKWMNVHPFIRSFVHWTSWTSEWVSEWVNEYEWMNGHEWKDGWMNWIIFEIWEALSRMYRRTTPIFENHTRWNKDLFGKLLTRCSRVTSFCTGQTSKFQQEFVHLFCHVFGWKYYDKHKICQLYAQFWWRFVGISWNISEIGKILRFAATLPILRRMFPEISETESNFHHSVH